MATGDTYQDRGTSKWLVLTSAPANVAAPTQIELNAGVDISADVAGVSGFEKDVSLSSDPSLATTTDYQTVQNTSFPASYFDLYRRENSTTVFDIFPEGTSLWLVAVIEGQGATKPSEVWPVVVANRTDLHARFGQSRHYRTHYAIKAGPHPGTQAA